MTEPAPRPPTDAERLRTLGLIRVALLLGVLMFGGITWLENRQALPAVGPALSSHALRVLVIVLVAAAVAGMLVVRVLLAREANVRRRGALCIIAWAGGEAAALGGGVYYFVFHDPRWYAVGLLVLVASFVVVPLRPIS